jgi:hypothetical protein
MYESHPASHVVARRLEHQRMCQLVQVRRAGLYRWLQEPQPKEEMEVRCVIQQIALRGVVVIGLFLLKCAGEVWS